MLEKFERPLNDAERNALRDRMANVGGFGLKSTLKSLAPWAAILVVCMGLFARGLFRQGGPEGGWLLILPAVSVIGILAFYMTYAVVSSHLQFSRCIRQFARDDVPVIEAALVDGRASVLRITSDRVVVIEPFEDEEEAYIFDLGDGTSLFLRGSYDYEVQNDLWPAQQFEIVRTELDQFCVGIFSSRGPITDVRTVPMEHMPEDFWYADEPKSESILSGSPDEVLCWLGHRIQQ